VAPGDGRPRVGQHNLDVLRKGKRRIQRPGLAPQHHVGRLQISMEDALGVGVAKRLGSRTKNALDDVEGRQAWIRSRRFWR
jgi:hypothetical protein